MVKLQSKILIFVAFFMLSYQSFGQSQPSKGKPSSVRSNQESKDDSRYDTKTVPRSERSMTEINFGDTLIEGQMKAPDGFFLQGRNKQAMSQMVRLRSHFRSELASSRAGVRYLSVGGP